MKHFLIIPIFLSLLFLKSSAQEARPFLHKNFDNVSVNITEIQKQLKESEYIHAAYTPSYCPGIQGKALDLTSGTAVRIPIILKNEECPSYEKDFSASLWIKTRPGAKQGTPVISNKKSDDRKGSGWIIGTNDNGAWYFNISDGESNYNYDPTPERQSVNDGKWHHICATTDLQKGKLHLYLDGKNVAIYNIKGLKNATSKLHTVIGGTDEYNDWGSRGEWTAFNGMIDEVKMWDKALTREEIQKEYHRFMTDNRPDPVTDPTRLKIQVWNIWHGGHRFGKQVGVERVTETLKKENADIIGLIETYGSGAVIADSLDYYFYLISSNLSIMSRHPIIETIDVFKPFYSGGVTLQIGKDQQISFFNIWLSASPDICGLFQGESVVAGLMKEEENSRQKELKTILKEINPYIKNSRTTPVIVCGDYNCGSHLDWGETSKALHYGLVIDWPASRFMHEAGFHDSFRQINPDPVKDPGFTWSPLINPSSPNQNCIRDRIDFIYYQGDKLTPYRSRMLDDSPGIWPSDHASMTTWFYLNN